MQFHARTPQRPDSVEKYGRKLQKALTKVGPFGGYMNRKTVEGFERFVRGAITTANSLNLATRDLEQLQKATAARKSRAKFGNQMASKGGVIKVSQCRELYSIRQKKEEEKAQRKKTREEKKAAKSQIFNIEFLLNSNPIEQINS